MYRVFRKAGMTVEGACAVLGQIQHEGAFRPNNAEDSKGVSDDAYTRQVDNGVITRYQFMYDGIGYGYAQWTFPDRKGQMYDFHRARGKSIGDSETQIQFLLWEMQHSFPVQWKLVCVSHDLGDCVKDLLYKWENPDNKEQALPVRLKSAESFYKQFRDLDIGGTGNMTKDEAVNLVLNLAREEVGYHEKTSNGNLDDKTANSGVGNFTKYARDLDALKNFYNGAKNGYAWCFTAGTLVLTDHGYKQIENIGVGDKVLSAFGDSFNDVVEVSYHEADVIDTRIYGCLPFSVTPDHPFLAEKRINKWHRNVGYRDRGFYPISDLVVHDAVSMPKSPVLFNDNLSYDDYWTLGYYAGDGYYSNGRYKLSANEIKAVEVEKHVDGRREKMYPTRTCVEYDLHSTGHELLFENLTYCGSDALSKAVPPSILFGNIEAKKAFLDGYFTADGCAAYGSFNSVSRYLVAGITRILYDIGTPCAVNVQERPEEGRIFDARRNDYRYFKQQPVIYNCSMNYNPEYRYQENTEFDTYHLVPVKEKSESTRRDIVYTITTNGDHTYTANNVGVHNCDVFYDWLFVKCFGAELGRQMLCQPMGSAGAGCLYSAQYYKQYGRWHTDNPQPGDQIFFSYAAGEYSHTGIVESVAGDVVNTIEGNSSDQVARKAYSIYSTTIVGFGRPKWELVADGGFDPDLPGISTSDRILKLGCKGDDVKKLQEDLEALGYDIGRWGADGDFGNDTMIAVMHFQTDRDIQPVDGEVGPNTRKALDEALKKKEEPEPKPQPASEPEPVEEDEPTPRSHLQIRTLQYGMEGYDVKLAQSALQCWGYITIVSGIFGKEMDEKIRDFQKAKGLDATGIVDGATWKELLRL